MGTTPAVLVCFPLLGEIRMSSGSGTRNCVKCGRTIAWDANVCQYCGYDFRMANAPAAPKETVKPLIGGALIILGAVVEFYWGYALIWSGDVLSWMPFDIGSILTMCGAILVILGIIALLGGVLAIMRKMYGIAMLGGILALPGAFIFGLIGLILVAMSHEEFKK
jgi:hypothetical protein